MAWNYRGLNDRQSPAIPYLRWLISSYHPTFLFLQETKMSVNSVVRLVRATVPTSFCGVDAVDTRGGLVVFCWGPFVMDVVVQCRNYVLCKISSMNGKSWHCLFLYGEPQFELRLGLWEELHHLLCQYTNYIIIGDINQVDSYADKLGGATTIRGWEDFNNWKNDLHLRDIPFHGPRFTWSNNRDDDDLIMERLDKAYASLEWWDDNPLAVVQNFPILHSDHAPIWLHLAPSTLKPKRPYQIENWCLRHSEVIHFVHEVWQLYIVGSPMYVLSRKLDLLRLKLKKWCLDKRLFWGVNWRRIFDELYFQGTNVHTLPQAVSVERNKRLLTKDS